MTEYTVTKGFKAEAGKFAPIGSEIEGFIEDFAQSDHVRRSEILSYYSRFGELPTVDVDGELRICVPGEFAGLDPGTAILASKIIPPKGVIQNDG